MRLDFNYYMYVRIYVLMAQYQIFPEFKNIYNQQLLLVLSVRFLVQNATCWPSLQLCITETSGRNYIEIDLNV